MTEEGRKTEVQEQKPEELLLAMQPQQQNPQQRQRRRSCGNKRRLPHQTWKHWHLHCQHVPMNVAGCQRGSSMPRTTRKAQVITDRPSQ
jgi:hypothetical protein